MKNLIVMVFSLVILMGTAWAQDGAEKSVEPGSTQAVLGHHLGAFAVGLEEVMKDFTEKSVVITPDATYEGLAEIAVFYDAFISGLPENFWDNFTMIRQDVQGEVAYIVWHAKPDFLLGTDTYVMRDGKIAAQTYAALPKEN
jgi:hypothetical protein